MPDIVKVAVTTVDELESILQVIPVNTDVPVDEIFVQVVPPFTVNS